MERLLRGVPDCELILLVRDGRRTPAAQRIEKELLKNDAFDRLRAQHASPESTETFKQMTARRITTVAGDVSADGLGLSGDDRLIWSSADTIIHSAATVSFDSPLDRAVEINLLGPTRIAKLCHDLGVTPHLVAVSTCYVAGNRRGNAPEELVSEGPFDMGLSWQAEVTAARRLKGDTEALSRQPVRLVEFRKGARAELGAAGAPALAGQDRTAARTLGQGPTGRGRNRQGRQPGMARCLRLHQGARRAGPHRLEGQRAGVDREAVDHRVGMGRAQAGLDPRIPHGRAGDHLVRPRPAQGVPRRARGNRRRDSGRHRRGSHHRRRRRRPRTSPRHLTGGLRRRQPAQVPGHDRLHQRLVHRAPVVRPRGPADPGARMELPRSRQSREPAQPGDDDSDPHGKGAQHAAVAGPTGRVHGDARRQAQRDRNCQAVRRAVRALHGVRGDLPGRQPARPLGHPRPSRP